MPAARLPAVPPTTPPPRWGAGPVGEPGLSCWPGGWPPPGRQQSLRRGLPCPSSDSSWQLWRNVLLTAVLLINGEHVCVAETFLVFFPSSSVWWKYRKTVDIRYKKGVWGGLLSSYPKGFLYLRSTHFGNRHFSNPWVSFPKCFHTSAPLCPAFLPYHQLVLMKSSSLQPCQVRLFFFKTTLFIKKNFRSLLIFSIH